MENSSRRLVRTGVSAGASFVALVTGLALGLYITVHALRGNPGAGTLLPSLAFGVLLSVVVQRLLRNPELWGITDEPSRVEPSRVEPSRVEQSSATPRLLYRSLRVLRAPPRAAPSYWWFWISLVVFVLAAEHGSRELGLTLAPVLLFHELGHYVAMRAFGYADARIFFLPLLGALTTSRASTAHPWQRALILLAGPVPGILLGALLMTATAHSWLAVGKLLISINLVNLLPLAALDGGRLLATLVPPRRGKLEIAVALVATLGAVLWLLASRRFVWASGLACTLMLLPLRLRVASSAAALTGEYPITIERCSPRQQIELFRVALAFGGPTPRRTPKGVASWMRTIHERYLDSRLSNLARAGVALVYLGSLALGSALLLR